MSSNPPGSDTIKFDSPDKVSAALHFAQGDFPVSNWAAALKILAAEVLRLRESRDHARSLLKESNDVISNDLRLRDQREVELGHAMVDLRMAVEKHQEWVVDLQDKLKKAQELTRALLSADDPGQIINDLESCLLEKEPT